MSVVSVLSLAGVGFATALSTVVVTFLIALRRGRYDTIDSAWGMGFAVIVTVSFTLCAVGFQGLRSAGLIAVVVAVLTAIWGVRLSVHLHMRNRNKPEDPRYQEIRDRGAHPKRRMFVRVYLTQAVAMWFVSLPVQFAMFAASPSWSMWVLLPGIAVWLIGFTFEVVGDEQLRRFRANPENEGAVLNWGLWRYTRHPNYFGDACVWWGLYLLAAHHFAGVATVLSPIAMTWLLARGTGKPMLERSLVDRRPAYAEYIRKTSGFFPLPPKRT